MLSKLRTFISFPASSKWMFIKIAVLVPLVEFSIKTLRFKRTLRLLRRFTGSTTKKCEHELSLINRHRNQFYLYQRQFPNLGKCLARSLVLWLLLDRQGIRTELKFGVKKEGDNLLAHAWIEYKGEALVSEWELGEDFRSFPDSILPKIVE